MMMFSKEQFVIANKRRNYIANQIESRLDKNIFFNIFKNPVRSDRHRTTQFVIVKLEKIRLGYQRTGRELNPA